MAPVSIGAAVPERLGKGSEKKLLPAQIFASVSLIVSMFNAFM